MHVFFHNHRGQFLATRRGFTVLEVLLVVAIVSLIGGFGMPVYYSFQAKNDLDLATDVTAQVLRRAHTLSRAMVNDDGWGVYIEPEAIVLFKGSAYATRDTSFDEISSIATSVHVDDWPVEVTFAKLSGDPTGAPLTVTLRSTRVNNTSIITVNEKGTISF